MKKLLTILMSLTLLPYSVGAATTTANPDPYAIPYSIGDKVAALLIDDTTRIGFDVIKESKAGDHYVYLMYSGTLGTALYDEKDANKVAAGEEKITGEFESATIYAEVQKLTEKWAARINGEARLPRLDDLVEMGINNSSGKYQIMQNRGFLVQNWSAGLQASPAGKNEYNYWTSSCETEPCTEGDIKMYVVTVNEDYNGDSLVPVGYLEPTLITDPLTELRHAIRPVVKVDKEYIDCNYTVPKTVPTAEVLLPIEFFLVAAGAGVAYIIIRKKEVFTQI